jgi:hypothetical protein
MPDVYGVYGNYEFLKANPEVRGSSHYLSQCAEMSNIR